jgi:hypothetical protein
MRVTEGAVISLQSTIDTLRPWTRIIGMARNQ